MAKESKTTDDYDKLKSIVPNLRLEIKKTQSGSSCSVPNSPIARNTESVIRYNCLCAPTTHVGSFRCRYHRNSGLKRSSMSVGSKLSDLAAKSNLGCEHNSHLQLLAANGQSSSTPTYLHT